MEVVLEKQQQIPARKRWMLALVLVAALIGWANGATTNCWSDDSECLVHATLHKNSSGDQNPGRESLPLDINCVTPEISSSTDSEAPVTPPPDYLLRRFERAYAVTLNGCHKAFKWTTFGFEFLPKCDQITELTVERFHADGLYTITCPSAIFIQVETLHFVRNDIATITAEALANLALLRELHFVANSLRHIERGAFDELHFIERIHFKHEPLLAIKEASIFEHTNAAELLFIGLKSVTSAIFGKLPQTLREIHVEQTAIGVGAKNTSEPPERHDDGVVSINNPRLLRNVTIIDCGLSVFTLNDDHDSLNFLNLSGNSLTAFQVTKNGTAAAAATELKILDLSRNQLTHLPLQWLAGLVKLEQLFLQFNYLKQLPLMPLLTALPAVQSIDLRTNKLKMLSEATHDIGSESFYRVRIRMDENPWNCMWLLDFAHSHPEKFRIFQYEKFLSQINVNGLECEPADKTQAANNFDGSATLSSTDSNELSTASNGVTTPGNTLNISTFTLIYGSPWEVKRNQRTEALIIVFMLPVGIAVLFLLLYLWIYCQKVFHLSYYRKCGLFRRKRKVARSIGNRFDVVRQIPPNSTMTSLNNNDGYEMPLNGVSPVCNCVHSTSTPNTTNDKCQKVHHITYVPLPDEQAQKIYEEIIGSGEDDCVEEDTDLSKSVHPIYDHLTFE